MSEPTPTSTPFSEADWAQFRSEDFAAARAVVILMIAIFGTGVIIYSIVAYSVMA